jgi:aspartyl-tRNA(Asn)/glutamyl-tRNA(Gln) amidotransferase subunit C
MKKGMINIKHLAKLAHLKLTREEFKKFTPQLAEVFELFERLERLNTKKTLPTFQTIPLKNISRRDRAGKPLNNKEALKNAKQKSGSYFKVKAIFS